MEATSCMLRILMERNSTKKNTRQMKDKICKFGSNYLAIGEEQRGSSSRSRQHSMTGSRNEKSFKDIEDTLNGNVHSMKEGITGIAVRLQ